MCQINELADRTVGPAMRVVFNVEDPKLQVAGFENFVSHLARAWVPFDSNLGSMEFSVTFVPKPKPQLNQRKADEPGRTGLPVTPAALLLTASESCENNF